MNNKRNVIIFGVLFTCIVALIFVIVFLVYRNRMENRMNMGRHLLDLKRYEEASRIYFDLAYNRSESRDVTPKAMYMLGKTFEKMATVRFHNRQYREREDFHRKAYMTYRKLLARFPDDYWAWRGVVRTADYLSREKKYDEALNRLEDLRYRLERIQDSRPTVRLREVLAEIVHEVGIVNFRKGEYREAKKYFDRVSSDNPELREKTDIYLARIQHRLGRPWRAFQAYKNFQQKHPTSPYRSDVAYAHYKQAYPRALKLYGKGKYKAAIRLFKDIIRRYPKVKLAENAQYWLAECYYSMKNYPRAIREFANVRGNKYSHKDVDSLFKEARSYYERKQYLKALARFEKLNDHYPNNKFKRKVEHWIEMVKRDMSYLKEVE